MRKKCLIYSVLFSIIISFIFSFLFFSKISFGIKDDKLLRYSEEYLSLRELREKSSNGEWIDDLDDYGGRMHIVMQYLGNKLGKPLYTKDDLIRFMGKPNLEYKAIVGSEYRYYWRGGHDYLIFSVIGNRVTHFGWYFALE